MTPRVLFVFVDGVGFGPDEADSNPFARFAPPTWTRLAGAPLTGGSIPYAPAVSGRLILDAQMGVPGLPQSATGQAALLTGHNVPGGLGRHVGPYPGAELRPMLATGTLWHAVLEAGGRAALANAFPDAYLERAARGMGRMGAIARSAFLAGVRLRGPDDLRTGQALSAFITNRGWRERLGYDDVPTRSPREAGALLGALARRHDLTVFEHYALDIAGHRSDWELAERSLLELDTLLAAARSALDGADVLVVASDHGNVEDMASTRHTVNPALGLWSGLPSRHPLAALTDIAPAILGALGIPPPALIGR